MTSGAIVKASVCPLDCPDTCSLSATVADDEVVQVRGSKVNPLTRGAICSKVANYYPEFVHGADRLHTPLTRVDAKGSGQFKAISWSEAITTIHEEVSAKIDRFGPQTVLPLNYATLARFSCLYQLLMRSGPVVFIQRKARGLKPHQISRPFLLWYHNPKQTWLRVPALTTPGWK